jgi:hypothetical protein
MYLNEKLTRFPDDWEEEEQDPSVTGKIGKSLVSMLKQRNLQLEALLSVERNNEQTAEINRKMKEVEGIHMKDISKIKESSSLKDSDIFKLNKELESLSRTLYVEKNSLSATKLKNEELIRIIKDQKKTIDSLLKQQSSGSRDGGRDRERGLKSSMDDISILLMNRKKRDLSDPFRGSGRYHFHEDHAYPQQSPYRDYGYNQGPYRGQDISDRDQDPRKDQNLNTEKDQNPYRNSEVLYSSTFLPKSNPQQTYNSHPTAPNVYSDQASTYPYPERPVYTDAPILKDLSAAPAVQVFRLYASTFSLYHTIKQKNNICKYSNSSISLFILGVKS